MPSLCEFYVFFGHVLSGHMYYLCLQQWLHLETHPVILLSILYGSSRL